MEGGYINEGGQLKTKNGQKYIINHRQQDGFYISKLHAILIAALIVIVMAAYAILLYFLFSSSYTAGNMEPSISNGVANHADSSQLQAAGFLPGQPSSMKSKPTSTAGLSKLSTAPTTMAATPAERTTEAPNDLSSRAIEFHEGWTPTLYTLVMQPFIENSTSHGHVVINIEKDTTANGWPPIVLDINNITVTKAEVLENGAPLNIKTSYGTNNETFIIELLGKPANKDVQVDLTFISQLTSTLQGFYRVRYDDIDSKEKKWLVSTQFSPIDARRAFPCFDRPDKKAQFKISMIRDVKRTMALSNMPSKHIEQHSPGYMREDFDITPKMSTYLVAFMVTDLIKTNPIKSNEIDPDLPNINIWSRKEAADMTQFAYDLTTKVLPLFGQYFGIKFNLTKIDMVAVPDFGFSAMENWGLITFRESALLIPTGEGQDSSAEHNERVASIIAHELAHQWFGNLVTMKWWDDLWLKEGFATFMSYTAIQKVYQNWRYIDFFAINELQPAMIEDSDESSRPLSSEVKSSADIRRKFDPISYSKGAAVIRMMQGFLGEDAFWGALKQYLHLFQYSNAVCDDLWNVMTEYGHKFETLPKNLTVKTIMDSWTLNAGYPILMVKRNGTDIHIAQKRYLLPIVNANDTRTWHIPISYVIRGNDTTPSRIVHNWLPNSTDLVLENTIQPGEWFYFNTHRTGYYRVNYDYTSWVALIRNYEHLPNTTIAHLVDDALNLARNEIITYDIPLTFLMKLRATDIIPWAASAPSIEWLTYMLNREPAYEHFRALMRFILKPIYLQIGFEEQPYETHVQLKHRALIVQQTCFFGFDYCTSSAHGIYRKWMDDKTQNMISPNLKSVVYCTALREGSYQEWYFAYKRYMETTSASEKEIILDALGCTTKPWLLAKYLNMTITADSGIRKQDGRRAFVSVAKNSVGYEIAFDFLILNIKQISDYFGDGFSTLSKMVDSITRYMNKEHHLEQLERFKKKAEDLGLKSVGGSIDLAVKKVKHNIFWRSRSYYALQSFLTILTGDLRINLTS